MRRKKELTLARIVLLAVPPAALLLALGAGVGALSMWLAKPDYWQRNEQWLVSMPRAELQRCAESAQESFVAWLTGQPSNASGQSSAEQSQRVLDRLANALEGRQPLVVAGDEPRTLQLSSDQINAWLATKGRPWLDRQGLHIGGRVQNLMIAFEERRPILAFELQSAGVTQVVSLVIDATLPDPRNLHFKLREVRGGTLGVRSGSVADPVRLMEDQLDEGQRAFVQQLRQGVTVEVSKVLQAADAEQQMVVKELSIEGDAVRVTLAGERKAP